MRSIHRHDQSGRSGFTLTELLVVVAIIVVLISLAIPASMMARDAANRSLMTSQLRSLTTAVFQYTSDNDGKLPGPFENVLNFRYNDRHPEFLVTLLVPYLGLPAAPSSGSWRSSDSLMTPKQRTFRDQTKVAKGDDKAHFYAISVSGTIQPFGDYGATASVPVMKLAAVPDPANFAMLMEADQRAKWIVRNSSGYSTLPGYPLHGNFRFVSYFDGSIRCYTKKESDR